MTDHQPKRYRRQRGRVYFARPSKYDDGAIIHFWPAGNPGWINALTVEDFNRRFELADGIDYEKIGRGLYRLAGTICTDSMERCEHCDAERLLTAIDAEQQSCEAQNPEGSDAAEKEAKP